MLFHSLFNTYITSIFLFLLLIHSFKFKHEQLRSTTPSSSVCPRMAYHFVYVVSVSLSMCVCLFISVCVCVCVHLLVVVCLCASVYVCALSNHTTSMRKAKRWLLLGLLIFIPSITPPLILLSLSLSALFSQSRLPRSHALAQPRGSGRGRGQASRTCIRSVTSSPPVGPGAPSSTCATLCCWFGCNGISWLWTR